VGPEGEQLGVVNTSEALQRARAQDLDLVEVAPMAAPPVCRIMDFGKFKYITSKREQEARKKQTVIQVKEIKVRPKTEEHDLNTKLKHIRRFLEEGDKVKVTVRFRGRELAYASQSGFEVLKHIVEAIADVAKVESAPKMEGKTMMAIVSPTMHKKKPVGGVEKPLEIVEFGDVVQHARTLRSLTGKDQRCARWHPATSTSGACRDA